MKRTLLLACLLCCAALLPKPLCAQSPQADSLMGLGQYAQAVPLLEQAVQAHAQPEERLRLQAKLSEAHTLLGDFGRGIAAAQACLQAIPEGLEGAQALRVDALLALSLATLHAGNAQRALEQAEQALAEAERLHPEAHPTTAQCLSRIGLAHWDLDHRQLALEYHSRALAIRQSLFGEYHVEVAASYNDLGLILANEQPKKAFAYYQQALKAYQQAYGTQHPKVANACLNMAYLERQQGLYPKARELAQQALDIWRHRYAAAHPNEAFVLNFIGELAADQQQWDEALSLHEQALIIYRQAYGQKHPKVANAYSLLGDAFSEMGLHRKAVEHYQEALSANSPSFSSLDWAQNPPSQQYYNAVLQLHTLLRKSISLEAYHYNKSLKFKHLDLAMQCLLACDSLIAQQRQLRTSKADKLALGTLASQVYERGIRLSLAMAELWVRPQHYRQLAFQFSEKGKAAVLLGAISDTHAKQYANIPDSLLAAEQRLKVGITSLEHQLGDLADPQQEAPLRQRLLALREDYRQFVANLEKQFPDYFALKYQSRTASVADVQQALGPDEALVSYFLAPTLKRLYAFVCAKGEFQVIDEPLRPDFQQQLTGFRNGLVYQVPEVWQPTGHALFRQLLGPWKKRRASKLCIVPDGPLWAVPFEALPTEAVPEGQPAGQTPFLLRQAAVSYAYSATLFFQQRQTPARRLEAKVLLCAPVEFEALSQQARGRISNLPGTEQEVMRLDSILRGKGLATEVLLHADAGEAVFKSEKLREYGILHLATHGTVDPREPDRSHILLQPGGAGGDDGFLFAGEIYNLQTRAGLVVLSACQTGLGSVSEGEGLIGLSRALLYAGAQRLMVSLWSVSDASTVALMQQFYQGFDGHEGQFGEALRQAKLELLRHEPTAEPYHWASFVLIGH